MKLTLDTMGERRRQLLLGVMNDDYGVVPYLFYLNQHTRCDALCNWLILNKFVGKNFLALIQVQASNSPLNAIASILAKIDKQKTVQPIFALRKWTYD